MSGTVHSDSIHNYTFCGYFPHSSYILLCIGEILITDWNENLLFSSFSKVKQKASCEIFLFKIHATN